MVIGLNSTLPEVRGAAIKALTYFADYLPVDISRYHQVILPAILSCINTSVDITSDKVIEKAVVAIDIFCDNLEVEDLMLYLKDVVSRLC